MLIWSADFPAMYEFNSGLLRLRLTTVQDSSVVYSSRHSYR